MMPTYLAVPVITLMMLVLAALPPLVQLARAAPGLAAAAAVAWLGLVIAIVRRAVLHEVHLLLALILVLLSGYAGRLVAEASGWPHAAGRVTVVLAGMVL